MGRLHSIGGAPEVILKRKEAYLGGKEGDEYEEVNSIGKI